MKPYCEGMNDLAQIKSPVNRAGATPERLVVGAVGFSPALGLFLWKKAQFTATMSGSIKKRSQWVALFY